MFRHILIPTDGSEVADKAVSAGIEFARESGAKVTLFTAVPEYRSPNEAQLLARNLVTLADHDRASERLAGVILGRAQAQAAAASVAVETAYVQSDHPWRAIIAAADRHGCDVIFMGSHGRKGLAAVLLGSETQEVLTHSSIPTLVYR